MRLMHAAIVMAVLMLSMLLFGCGTMTTTVTQLVPVPIPCDLPDLIVPALPIDALPPSTDVFSVGRALWATLETLEAYIGKLKAAEGACRSEIPPPTQ